jgi:uncharacterized glyoxalase superfamily protein PhnB
MGVPYKPQGYNSVSPYLVVRNAAETIDFLQQVFDASELRRMTAPDGAIIHAELRIDDTVVMVGEAGAAAPPMKAHVHVYVTDVDEVHARALEAGAHEVQAPMRKDDDKRSGVLDANGVTWWIGTKVD